jgi:YHS domain-containing protein
MNFATADAPAAEPEPEGIPWRDDYARALDEARTSDRLLWIQFTGPWCPNCTRMERDSFPDPEVRKHARAGFIPLKLRADVDQELALSFELSGLPATVIVGPSRRVLAVRQGYLGPDELGELLQGAAARHERENAAGRGVAPADEPGPRPRPEEARGDDEPTAPGRSNTETRPALSGYCPVSLVSDRRLVSGQAEYATTHEGRLYRFASPITLDRFRRDPGRYVPVNEGNCPVSRLEKGQVRPGDARYGVLFQGRLFLCAGDDERRQFLGNPARYAAIDVVEKGFCPHCLDRDGMLVAGDPRFDLNRDGRHYWFPDASHRAAFLAGLPTNAARH